MTAYTARRSRMVTAVSGNAPRLGHEAFQNNLGSTPLRPWEIVFEIRDTSAFEHGPLISLVSTVALLKEYTRRAGCRLGWARSSSRTISATPFVALGKRESFDTSGLEQAVTTLHRGAHFKMKDGHPSFSGCPSETGPCTAVSISEQRPIVRPRLCSG